MMRRMTCLTIICVLIIADFIANAMWISVFIENPPDHPWAEIAKVVLVHLIGILILVGIYRRPD